MSDLIKQVIAAFNPDNGVRVEKLDPNDKEAQAARVIEGIFTGGVGFLCNFPRPTIQSLGKAIWDIFHHRRVSVAVGPAVPALSLAAYGNKANLQALVLAPRNWVEMVMDDPIMQLGGIVFVGSQAVDFYNGRILTEHNVVLERARSYESEFILGMELKELNSWQRDTVELYPNGFEAKFQYERRAVEPMS